MDSHIVEFMQNFDFTPYMWVNTAILYMLAWAVTAILCIGENGINAGSPLDKYDHMLTLLLWPIIYVFVVAWIFKTLWTGPRKLWRHK